LSQQFRIKAIGVLTRGSNESDSRLTSTPYTGIQQRSVYTSTSDEGETIGRVEFVWKGWQSHTLRFGGEIVQNFLDSEARLVFDDGSGFEELALPGSTTRVEELRAEIFLTDSWVFSNRINIDTGIAVEVSEIEQTGDADLLRKFTYPKPFFALTFSQSKATQWRFRFEREVGQLDFNEFVSSANFDDGDLDLGNPDLQPEQTWVFEVAYEHRFSDIGVIEIAPYYNSIEEVEDLLPIGGIFEAPGNIGDGKRWGVEFNLSTGFDFVGLTNTRFDFSYNWQDSSVTDPVSGEDRPLSNERAWSTEASVRKDFPGSRASVGLGYVTSDDNTAYGVDEIVMRNYTPGLSVFYEVTLGRGTKLRFDLFNLLEEGGHRHRAVYAGSRTTGVLRFTETSKQDDNIYFNISLSGAL